MLPSAFVRFASWTLALLALLFCDQLLAAQSATGSVQGAVSDPSGARIPNATITLTGVDGTVFTAQSGPDGQYVISKAVPGTYTVSATAKGFVLAKTQTVKIQAGQATLHNLTLDIATTEQQVTVNEEASGLETSPDSNAGAIVIKGKDLDALSDDPDQLQDELNALAGPAAGPNGGQIYIDGFTGGQLPPKSSIREIRINQNPFSAEYDKLGYGRIEILTKPGTDKLHGMFLIDGNDSAFNSLNTFVTSEPAYYSTFMLGNASGSLNSKASWFVSGFRRDNQANSIINAELPDANGGSYNYSQAVSNPQTRLDLSPRLDIQLTPTNTLTVRYMYDRQASTNDGVSQFALESQAYNTLNQESTLQVSDTQVLGPNLLNETRFQYIRDRDNEIPQDFTPTVTVQGAFTGGGSNNGTVRDNQDHFELQNYTTWAKGAHSIRFGTRLRAVRDANSSTSGFNGDYTYASLSSYAAHQPSQYSVTVGNPVARVILFDAGVFFEDDWRVRSNFTFSYGLRYEGQNRISDHADLAPRMSFAWAPFAKGSGPAKTVIRGGYGWFFDRFQSTNVLQAIQQNGINQQTYVVKNPDFTQNAPGVTALAASASAPTTYRIAPDLKAPVNMQAAIGLEHQFGRSVTVSTTYINSRGVHQLYSDNINAFLTGTYDLTTGTGVRPNGINENIYQFESGGIYKQNQLITNYSVRARKLTLFGFYILNFAKADTSGATYFPSNQFDPAQDYGRATFDVHQRFILGGNYQAPFGISISPFLVTASGTPFNIAVGEDLNGDNQFNDRPAFATSSSSNTVNTKYGSFDLSPGAFETRIPYNYGNGPSEFSTNVRLSKSIGIGPKTEGRSGGFNGPTGGGGGGRGGPGGPPGGGLGPGGLSSSGGRPPTLDPQISRRYTLNFSVMGRNIFNNVNLAAPVGVLESPLFGKSNALAGGFFSSPSSNRSIDLQMSFTF